MNDLINRLQHFANAHRMMFGLHPDNQLIREAIAALEALEASPEPEEVTEDTPVTPKAKGKAKEKYV